MLYRADAPKTPSRSVRLVNAIVCMSRPPLSAQPCSPSQRPISAAPLPRCRAAQPPKRNIGSQLKDIERLLRGGEAARARARGAAEVCPAAAGSALEIDPSPFLRLQRGPRTTRHCFARRRVARGLGGRLRCEGLGAGGVQALWGSWRWTPQGRRSPRRRLGLRSDLRPHWPFVAVRRVYC